MIDPPGPSGNLSGSESIAALAAALRADAVDIDTLVRVLSSTIGEVLPPGMVEAERDRTITDRLTGREGTPIGIMITMPGIRLSLKHGKHRGGPIQAQIERIVRDVVISRREVNLDEWVNALAGALSDLASRNANARQALIRLLERDR
jgi:hypothetical protein